MLRARFAICALVWTVAYTQPQEPAPADLRFDVASVKPAAGGRGGSIGPAAGRVRWLARNASLKALVTEAYQVKIDQVSGGPDWVDRERFDIDAKAEGRSTTPQFARMLQNLLRDRFELRVRIERKTMPAYVLAVDKEGAPLAAAAAGEEFSFTQSPGDLPHQVKLQGRSVSLDYFVWRLGRLLDLPVVDSTGLPGAYDLDLLFIEDIPSDLLDRAAGNGRAMETHPTIFEALRKQLGLRLTPGKAPVDTVAIESASRPRAN
jgi:uncharacterized protein (TIGR03435 family)